MKKSSNSFRIGIAVAIIVGTIGWLAYSGYGSSKSYYVTIAELRGMGDKAYKSNLRVEGFVKPGSIEQSGTHVTFVLNEFESHSPKAATGHALLVNYKAPSRRPTPSRTMPRRWQQAPLAAMASSMPRSCRPSAPASMRRLNRGNSRRPPRLPIPAPTATPIANPASSASAN